MSSETDVQRAIRRANRVLPGTPAPEEQLDPRWQTIIRVGEFIHEQPEAVWQFAHRWGKHAQADLRRAIATCLLEHLLEYHFDLLFPRVRQAAIESRRFADTFSSCWVLGEAAVPKNAAQMKRLKSQIGSTQARARHPAKPSTRRKRARRALS